MKKILSLFAAALLSFTVLYAQDTSSVAGLDEDYSAENSLSGSDFSNTIQMAMSNADYMVTAGDIYSLSYSANGIAVSYTIPVDPTYKIRVSNLAVLDASGKSFLTLKKQVEEIVQKNYPMSGVQFVLTNPASFKVVVTGEVKRTVEKQAWALTRLSSVVSGTMTGYSSIRDVTVTSKNGKKRTYDLFKATRDGDLSQNPFVRPGDVITLNRIKRKVTISGSIERPGTYELMKGENLKNLVEYYGGGLTELADTSRIILVRNRENMDAGGEKLYIGQTELDKNYELLNGDSISIASKGSLLPYIVIEGIINMSDGATANQIADDDMSEKNMMRRRTVKFYEGENYATFIRRYKGMFNSYSDLVNAYVERNGSKIAMNLEEMIEDELYMSKYLVERNDKLVVPFQQHFVNVLINGEVNTVREEAAWPLRRLSTILDGNLTAYSSTRNVMVTSVDGVISYYDLFKSGRDGDLSQNPYIRAGETITVLRMERKVTISGAVERPGTYELKSGEGLRDLVEYYGHGLAELADTSRIEIVRSRDNMDVGGEKSYLTQKDIDSNYALLNRDSITIHSKSELLPYIVVEGIINMHDASAAGEIADDDMATKDMMRRRTIKFYDGENYATLVRRYKGIFNSYSDLVNAYVERNGEKIAMNLEEMLEDKLYMSKYLVERNDKLVVPFQQHFVNVLINGEVNTVREEAAWPLRRLSTILDGNLTAYSSTRNVMVTSVDGVVTYYDLFKSGRDGDLEQNPYIRAGETITVLRMERKVTISGAVERPGTYELKSGEGLKDLVEYYGHGLAELADTSRIELVRSRDNMDVGGEKSYLAQKDIDSNYALLNRDSIKIHSKSELLPYIVIEGIINLSDSATADKIADDDMAAKDIMRRRTVKFYDGENYATFIRRYKGIFNNYSDLVNSYVERNGEKIAMNLEEMIEDELYMSKYLVERNDKLVVPFQQHFVNVLINGEVTYVREEAAWPLRRLSAILDGNLTAYSSTRDVIVTSVDGIVSHYDLFKASRDGDLTQNPYIRAGETITVQRIDRKVTISGSVERPGTYQLLPGENIQELIDYYGHGLTEMADTSRIELLRVLNGQPDAGEKIYLNQKNVDEDYELMNHDSLTIGSFFALKPVMFVEGAIKASDSASLQAADRVPVQFENKTNYAYLIRAHSSWFTSAASDTKNAFIIRGDQIIPIDIDKCLFDKSYYSDLTVEADDVLRVPFRQYFVSVAGAVHNPGRYPYIPDRTYDYYVGLAGGFIQEKNNLDAVDIVDINGKRLKKSDVITPETTITAKANSGLYYFNQYSGIITTVLSLLTTALSAYSIIRALNK